MSEVWVTAATSKNAMSKSTRFYSTIVSIVIQMFRSVHARARAQRFSFFSLV